MKALNKQKLTNLLSVIIALATVAAFIPSYAFSVSDSEECGETDYECKRDKAAEKEQYYTNKANEAQSTANEYQARVNQLAAEVASMSAQIAESEARVAELQKQIEETEKKLLSQQEILADLLVQIHFENKTEPITILASSSTISDYAEQKNRIETLRNQINISAENIKANKKSLEEDQQRVLEILESQKAMRSALAAKQSEQAELVSKYANDASAYAADAEKARAEKQAAIEAYILAHPETFSSNGTLYSGLNTYPWQADCPGRADTYGTAINGRYVGGYVCECVSYAGWKAYEYYGVYLSWGNANTWDDVGRIYEVVDHVPTAHTIAQTDAGYYGHVVWVESVNGDGSINITEYNNAYSSASGAWHDFGGRVIPASQAASYNFIHVDRLVK